MGTMGILKVQSFGERDTSLVLVFCERDTSLVLVFYWNAIWV
jgi:hypothetical protein